MDKDNLNLESIRYKFKSLLIHDFLINFDKNNELN